MFKRFFATRIIYPSTFHQAIVTSFGKFKGKLATLTSVSPIDGRYNGYTRILQDYFSEAALIKFF